MIPPDGIPMESHDIKGAHKLCTLGPKEPLCDAPSTPKEMRTIISECEWEHLACMVQY